MKVITIVYNGSEVPQQAIGESLIPMLSRFISDHNVVVKQYNEEDLLKMGITATVGKIANSSKDEALQHAVTYIVGKLGEQIKEPVQLTLGFLEIMNTPQRKMLKNAIDIIYENRNVMTAQKQKSLGLPNSAFKTIISFKENYNV